MVNLPRIRIPPLGWAGLPLLSSVKGRIIVGFALLIIILIAVVAGSAWLARGHRSDLADLEQRAATTSLLEDAKFDATLANLLLERYVTTGNGRVIPVIRSMVAGAMDSAAEASARIEADGREADAGNLDEIVAGALFLSEASEQVIALRQGGDVEEARAALEEASPRIAEFGIVISEVAEQQRQEVPAFRSRADRTADLAFRLLIISGAGGVILGLVASVFIARSILKPLSSVESVALAVAGGDFEARAQTSGPKELARLGTSLNQMTESLLGLNRSREEEVGELEKEIAERTRVEEKVRELLESAPDATIIVDSSGAIRLVNAQAERLFGYRREELLGLPVEALMSDGERGRHAYDRASYFANPHPRAMGSGLELYARHKDGHKIPVEISLSPIGAEEGGLVSTSIRDITERKRTEEALRESETNSRTLAKFRTLMESIAAACFIFKGTKIWYTNSA